VAHRAGETFDLILRFRDGGLDGDDVLHILRLFEQLLQARKLDLRRFQTRLRVVILLADIFRRVVLPRHMAERAHLRAEVSELLRRHANGIARVAITAGIVRKVLLLEVSAAALHKRGNVLHRLLVPHVAGIALCPAAQGLNFGFGLQGRLLGPHKDDGHVRAVFRQLQGNGFAQPLRSAGYQRDLSFQLHVV